MSVDEKRVAPDLAAVLREIADRYEAWMSSLSTPPTTPSDDDRQLQEFFEENLGPDPHPLATSLQRAVDSGLIERVCNLLLARGLPDAAAKLKRQHDDSMQWLSSATSPVSDRNRFEVNLAFIDIFVVRPMTSLCRDLADGIEAQHKAPSEPLANSSTANTSWKRPDNSLNAKEIRDRYGVPRATLQRWEQQDNVPDGPLYGKVEKAPGCAHTSYYPDEWVKERVKTWQGKDHKR